MIIAVLEYDGFDWDKGNIAKIDARIRLKIVEDFFKQKLLIKEDLRHSQSEQRFLAIGYTREKRCLVAVYTLRMNGTDKLIRPISVRYTHQKEEKAYEAELKKIEEAQNSGH